MQPVECQDLTPLLISVGRTTTKGELKDAPMPTAGHLVLIWGADKKYVYVNDPAVPTSKTVSRRYLKNEFIKAWKGVAYILDEKLK